MICVTNPKDCCGCTACASICAHGAISMKPDSLGFSYPIIDNNKCVECGLCETCCPILQRKNYKFKSLPLAYKAVRHENNSILKYSTSGGTFSALACYILEKNGVVYGVSYNVDMEVVHSFAETEEGCRKFVGSKYVQSNLNGIFSRVKSDVTSGKYVLFTGTPCQVAGLRSFMRKEYKNLILVDIICHAVPSPKLFKDYIKFAECKFGSKLTDIRMRDKEKFGWGHKTSTRYIFENNDYQIDPKWLIDWNTIYFSSLANRPSCSDCKFCNLQRPGDITMGDFWDDNNRRPDIFNKYGTSLVIINTQKGKDVIDEIDMYKWDISQDEAMQYNLQQSSPKHPLTEEFLDDYILKGFSYVYFKYFKKSKFRRMLDKIKLYTKRILYENRHINVSLRS